MESTKCAAFIVASVRRALKGHAASASAENAGVGEQHDIERACGGWYTKESGIEQYMIDTSILVGGLIRVKLTGGSLTQLHIESPCSQRAQLPLR